MYVCLFVCLYLCFFPLPFFLPIILFKVLIALNKQRAILVLALSSKVVHLGNIRSRELLE